MNDIKYWDQQIERLQEEIHEYQFSDNIYMDKRSIMSLLSDLTTAHSERKKVLIREKKLQDTRSFWRKKWDFCKESPSLAFFILMVWLCIVMALLCVGLEIYSFGIGAFIRKVGEFIMGIFGLLLFIGFLGIFISIKNFIRR